LTYNEERHIERCLRSARQCAERIFVVDSFSTDQTVEIARRAGAEVIQNAWTDHATQLNWALENLPILTKWVMRIDADEYLTPGLQREISVRVPALPGDVTGIYVKRRVLFMQKWIRHGGFYPAYLLRIWRHGMARCEQRRMDEHMIVDGGSTITFDHDLVDENLNDIGWWTDKHNRYATREAVELLSLKYGLGDERAIAPSAFHGQVKIKRALKEQVYARLPLGIRPCLYFLYRYFFRFGLLDGFEGMIFHFLQGFWYRFLVDVKIHEIEKKARNENRDIRSIIVRDYGIAIGRET
jgi:glycosyltransferase involved in cell wall biosynthesis